MFRGILPCTIGAWCALLAPHAPAHPALSDCVQHDIRLEAGPDYIDLTVRLTFFDRHAAVQEAFADADGDGHISRPERAAYGRDVLEQAARELALSVDGEPVELAPLHDAALTLPPPGDAPHRRFEIELVFFAPAPPAGRGEAPVQLRNGLFPDYAAMTAFHVAGRDGVRVRAAEVGQPLSRAAGAEEPPPLEALLIRSSPEGASFNSAKTPSQDPSEGSPP